VTNQSWLGEFGGGIVSLQFTSSHLDALGLLTWSHFDSLGFTWFHLRSSYFNWFQEWNRGTHAGDKIIFFTHFDPTLPLRVECTDEAKRLFDSGCLPGWTHSHNLRLMDL